MSKARARERKKKRLARAQETGKALPPVTAAPPKHNPGKFDPQLTNSGKGSSGKNIPNAATANRGAARSG